MNKKMKFSTLFLALLLLWGTQAFALQCQQGRDIEGSSDLCYSSVKVASNETTLVSLGTVLVYDVANAQFTESNGAFQVRVATTSAGGVFVAGIAQGPITSGQTALVLVRGRGDVATKTTFTIASGDGLYVSTSGDASNAVSSNALSANGKSIGFALDGAAASGNSRTTRKAYITIV